MNKRKLRTELARLVRNVREDISSEYRAFEGDEKPGIQLTVGARHDSWSFQTGDNSFSGGAYGYPHWGVIGVYRDTNSFEAADDLIGQLDELGAFARVVN
jgi:hypothetical protein